MVNAVLINKEGSDFKMFREITSGPTLRNGTFTEKKS